MKNNGVQIMTDLLSVFAEIKSDFFQLVPSLVTGLVILLVGIFLAFILKVLSSLIVRGVAKALPNQIYEKSLVQNNMSSLSRGAGRVVFSITLLLTVATALNKMGLAIVSAWLENLAKYLPNIVVALMIAFLGWKLKEVLSDVLCRALSRTDFKHSSIASNTVAWTVFIISLLVSFEQVGIDMGLIVTISTVLVGVVAGGIVLTFALGAKTTISDILACYQLHRFMKPGQKIEVNGYIGTVESIGPTFLLLNTKKGKVALPGSRFRQEATLIQNSEKS